MLGCSFDLLGDAVLREWDMPDTIVQALTPLPSGALKPARSRQEWLQQVAAFGTAAANLAAHVKDPGQDAASKALLVRFGPALNLDEEKLEVLFATVSQETQVLVNASIPMLQDEDAAPEQAETLPSPDVPVEEGLPDELLLSDESQDETHLLITARHASGKPLNARDLLVAGVQDVTEMMASGQCKVNDLMLLVLETLYTSLGFRFATVCLKDVPAAQFRARIAIGEGNAARQNGFVFPVAPSRNLFHLALDKDADLMISDADSPKIRDLIPGWHRALLPDARSFIVLPLVVDKKQIGLFYADRNQPAPEGVPPDETALIKTLKGQVLAALKSR